MNIDESIFSKLTDEQKKRVSAAKTPEEFMAVAKEAGYELSQSQLNAISGGGCWCTDSPEPCDVDYPCFAP